MTAGSDLGVDGVRAIQRHPDGNAAGSSASDRADASLPGGTSGRSDGDVPLASNSTVNDAGVPVEAARRWLDRVPALTHAAFRAYLVGHAISVIGFWMQHSALNWYVHSLWRDSGSEFWLGLTAAVTGLPLVLFSTLGGMAADQLPKRWLIVGTQSAAMVLAFVLAGLVLADAAPMGVVLLLAGVAGLVMAFDIPARQSFHVEMVGRDHLLSAIALNSSVFNTGRLVGPMVASWTIATLTYALSDATTSSWTATRMAVATCFVLNGVSYLVLLINLIRMRLVRAVESPRTRPRLLDGFRVVRREPQIRGLIMAQATLLLSAAAYLPLMAALADNTLDAGVEGFGVLLTANGVGSLTAALFVASRNSLEARRWTILGGLAGMATGLLGLVVAPNLWAAVPFMLLTGGGFVMFLTSANSTIQLSVGDSVRGRVMAVWVLTFGATQPLGGLIGGQIADLFDVRVTLLLGGLGALAAGVLAYRTLFSRGLSTDDPRPR